MPEKVHSCPLPPQSQLHQVFEPGDFLDCFSVRTSMAPRPAAEIIANFPGWVQALTALRTALVAPFGLKTEIEDDREKVGGFPVISDNGIEVIAGFDDKHLDFRISVLKHEERIYLSTWVHRHNIGGRIYLAAIMPFHILVARDALARVARSDAQGAASPTH